METPAYPPAAAYAPPLPAPAQLHVWNTSLAELMSAPAAWAIVLKHKPMFSQVVSAPQLKPHLTNMMVGSFITFGGFVTQADLDAIDQDLQALAPSQWPAL